jgi:hypothetical protein
MPAWLTLLPVDLGLLVYAAAWAASEARARAAADRPSHRAKRAFQLSRFFKLTRLARK